MVSGKSIKSWKLCSRVDYILFWFLFLSKTTHKHIDSAIDNFEYSHMDWKHTSSDVAMLFVGV